ncbi:ABC transporter ATP-binding protein [Mycobacterium intermedium]|uniref:ABC transporter ATP-binding protein n=1 Tax=Mycobacterium intermedium TaxID=28445 RepID=A0A1E3SJA4_MYCIE|nr:ATP-binding cassette domain-containing protein [Mycobacterium intermedium]MCV6963790.1 ATP-binding cassette domain-containing protein [Mycobacterium intermedium]ODR02230.1 ABC transporter ATP-binding protein [Mycobacterium intermedium]OPE46398.1 ABC transporter ATP-binding protein [Mycobacterium intermedium]ORB10142.1 ABC transporter ATP-binding protein [Mycobacterium intermedium]
MSAIAVAPVLVVKGGGTQRRFAAGCDAVVGSDPRADLPLADPSIAGAHLLLRFDRDRWVAIDNGTRGGTFVNHRRVQSFDICDGQTVNIGDPEGPCLTFEVATEGKSAERPPTAAPTRAVQAHPHPGPARGLVPAQPLHPVSHPRPTEASTQPSALPQRRPRKVISQRLAPPPPPRDVVPPRRMSTPDNAPPDTSNLATKALRVLRPRVSKSELPPGITTIGRSKDNGIVVSDVLASRCHAFLVQTPIGTEIRDFDSTNGTYVNGIRVGSALLEEGNVVTIGNTDLVFADGKLLDEKQAERLVGGLQVNSVRFSVDGKELLDNVSLAARPGTLTAIIGGSGAGKTTLARLIAGYTRPSAGSVTFDGHDIHANYTTLRSRIGMVPQDDVVHRQLTVNQALGYAAELRLPPDTSKADRDQVVARVLGELGLSEHGDTRVDKLSGGQRKRASVALELLTGPSLLMLDEPTTGLDPALDSQVMVMLRELADAGRTVVVVTHSVSYLDLCDQVLLMAPGGRTAYFGPPDQIQSVMGSTNWARIFLDVGANPEEAKRRFLSQKRAEPRLPRAARPGDLGEPVNVDVKRQFLTLARRQVRLVVSDRYYTAFLAILPFILGALALTVPGHSGFGYADPNGKTPAEPAQILVLLIVGAVFMGNALTIRDLIGERAIFHREQAFGVSTRAYLMAKVVVFAGFATLQAAVVTTITLIGKGAPTRGAVLLGNPTLELFVAVATTCVASAMLGLVLSSVARSSEQILPLLVVAIMVQLVFSSGMIPVTNRVVLDQLSWLAPARWGFAASAATIDLNAVEPSPFSPKDSHWNHDAGAWLLDMAMLAVLSVVYGGIVLWKTRLKR